MYRPYVGGKNINRKHLSTILDVEIEYGRKASHVWWIVGLAIAALGAALWLDKLPL